MSVVKNSLLIGQGDTNSLKERLLKYVKNWPLFAISLLLCIGAGLLYARYVVPQYMATTKFLIRENELGGKNSNDLIEAALSGKRAVNLNNEMLLISSSGLMERTVYKNEFNILYYKKGKLLNIEIYKDCPFRLIGKGIKDSSRSYRFALENINAKGGFFKSGEDKDQMRYAFNWNQPFIYQEQVFQLDSIERIMQSNEQFIVDWLPVKWAAGRLLNNFFVRPYDSKTSVVQLSLKTENLQKGKDILNSLFEEFNLSDIEERNFLSDRTVGFIDERLIGITNELKGVEGNLENYQNVKQLVDVRSQSDQSLSNTSDVNKAIRNINVQQGLVKIILQYFSSPESSNKLVPSSLGLNDQTLATLIAAYNEVKLKKEREAQLVAPQNPIMQDLGMQLTNLRTSILESLNNISKNLELQEINLHQQNVQYRSFLSSLPHNERVLQEIKRKQSITEGLYLYLLQKREEAAISRTAYDVANYRQIDKAVGYGPVEPNNQNIILSAIVLGLMLAFGWIYFKDLLNDKVMVPSDISSRLDATFAGEISYIPKRKRQPIVVLGRDIISEQFRAIRTSLAFMMKNNRKQVFLITSSNPGEGKSFTSLNLAAVMALPGKKVALLELDIRKPAISSNLQMENSIGLSDFLAGKVKNYDSLFFEVDEIPGLHIFPAGLNTENAADLLLSENLKLLINDLKKHYDYVVLDSPPVGLFKDALVIASLSDIVLYVVRYNQTLKKDLKVIEDIMSKEMFLNLGLILNGVRSERGNGYSGYDKYFQKQSTKKVTSQVYEHV